MPSLPDAKQIAGEVTLKAHLPRLTEWTWRVKIGAWLIRLAALIMWMDIEIDAEDDPEPGKDP